MEFGQYQLQIFVSLVVILGAAFVALICDFLKGNNEQLRELTLELKVRREEEQKRSQLMMARSMGSFAEPAENDSSGRSPERAPEKMIDAHRVPRALANPVERKRAVAPEALAAMERGAQLAGAPRRTKPVQPLVPQEIIEHEAAEPTNQTEAVTPVAWSVAPAKDPVVIVEPVALSIVSEGSAKAASSSPASGPAVKLDWNQLLNSRRAAVHDAAPDVRTHVIIERIPASKLRPGVEVQHNLLDTVRGATASPGSSQAEQTLPGVPAGFHEGLMLSQLVQTRQPVSGLVVSIGVSISRKGEMSIPEPVRQLVQSLIGPGDFACQSGADEFLLIYPNERGASAQRRLSALAQQLWDFQLRSLGNFSILFSWGGVEVKSESIDEAIASASERMQETKRGRRVLEMSPASSEPLRQAV